MDIVRMLHVTFVFIWGGTLTGCPVRNDELRLFLECIGRELDQVGSRQERGQTPKLFTPALGKVEIDFFEVVFAVMAGDALRFDAQEFGRDAIGQDIPGVLNGVALLDTSNKEVRWACFMGISSGRD